MKKFLFAVLALCLPFCVCGSDVAVESEASVDVSSLSAAEFLKEIRQPLRRNVWGEFTGSINYKGTRRMKGKLRVRITFTPSEMFTQIVLNDKNVYSLEQKHGEGTGTTAKIEMPEAESLPGLFDFGVRPEDMTFSFIYWDFKEELPREKRRMSECRVMILSAPDGSGTVKVWFHAKYGFPMEADWFKNGESKPWRHLELKGAKRHENGLWFVREMRLEGKDWKSQVTFDHVELNNPGE